MTLQSSKYLWLRARPRSCGLSNFLGYVSQQNTFTSVDQGLLTKKKKNVLSSKTKEATSKKSGQSSAKSTPPTHSKEILNYFESRKSLDIMNELPKKILKRTRRSPDVLYIADRDAAKQLVARIKSSVLRADRPILEANAGCGLVSEELMSAGASHMYLFESNTFLGAKLNKLANKYPGQLEVRNFDLFLIYKQAFQDKLDGGSRVERMLSGITKKSWADDPAMTIIGTLPHENFLKHLIMSFVFQNGIMMYGRPELYLVIPPSLFIHLTCDSSVGYLHYRSTTVLFQLIFRWKLLDKIPRNAYLPWEAEYTVSKRSKLAKVRCIDPEYLYLVRIEPREDFFETVVPADQLQPLWFFVRQNLLSRKNQVIPQLEKWIPGCGPRLIMGGISIFTQFGDLTPQEILAVFREFSKWPEFPHCPFLPSMETNFLKMETVPEDLEKEIDENVSEEHEGIDEEDIETNLQNELHEENRTEI